MASVIYYLPNILNYIRILFIVLMLFLIRRRPYFSFLCCVISGFIDSIDGDLARLTNQSSRLGYLMDLGMDKLTSKIWFNLNIAEYKINVFGTWPNVCFFFWRYYQVTNEAPKFFSKNLDLWMGFFTRMNTPTKKPLTKSPRNLRKIFCLCFYLGTKTPFLGPINF